MTVASIPPKIDGAQQPTSAFPGSLIKIKIRYLSTPVCIYTSRDPLLNMFGQAAVGVADHGGLDRPGGVHLSTDNDQFN